MAQSSPQKEKLPRGKADTYSVIALSDTAAVAPLLSQLSIATCNPSVENDVVIEPPSQVPDAGDINSDVITVPTRMSCACCAVEFSHRTEQKAHFKSDWHRYNLKRQLKGEAGITEDQFEAVTGEVSSISGSDDTSTSSAEEESEAKRTTIPARLKRQQVTDSTDTTDSEGEDNSSIMAATRKHPKVFLRNGSGQLVSLYRCVLYHKKTPPNTPGELLTLAEQAKGHTRVAMVMLAGGHFSAAIFDGTEVVVHKTFHRYVVRAKRGFVQSVRDSQGSAPKSGGASLRRYNEAALAQEVQELLSGWSQHLQSCHLIFLRTSAYSRHIFFGSKSPIFSKDDRRVRTVPFTMGRPTFNEAKRVHHMLMSVECFGDESLVKNFVPVSPPRRLHPDTGQLVIRPDTTSPRAAGKLKAKDRKARKNPVEETKDADKEEEAVDAIDDDDNQSDVEVELVETMEEISTDNLQEFACSVSGPRRQNKRKKKNRQKGPEKESTETVQRDHPVEWELLSEEDARLKNKLYTCCKSGDVTQLSQLLEQLTLKKGSNHGSPSPQPHQPNPTTDNLCSPHIQTDRHPECQPPQPCVGSHTTPPHTTHTTDTTRTSATEGLRTARPDGVEQAQELKSVEQSDGADVDQSNQPSVLPGQEECAPESASSLDSSQKASDSADGGKVSPCDADVSVEPCQQRFERVVLGRYGERGYSLLHVASAADQGDVITALLEAGCDPCVRDSNGKIPYSVANTKDARNTFRRFRGSHPDRYDYDSAQIPSALTADMEADRKQREAEKKKQQKKAKQERLKERKAEEAKTKQEQKEKDRFLALSDREKRAIAAERRLLTQASEQGTAAVLSRCFQCGLDISGKVPFEYMQFTFCSPKCLKEHRMKGTK